MEQNLLRFIKAALISFILIIVDVILKKIYSIFILPLDPHSLVPLAVLILVIYYLLGENHSGKLKKFD